MDPIERAIARTRKNAWVQLAFGVLLGASVAFWPGSSRVLNIIALVHTHEHHVCGLLVDHKRRDDFTLLVEALRTRSPNAIFSVANEHVGRSVA